MKIPEKSIFESVCWGYFWLSVGRQSLVYAEIARICRRGQGCFWTKWLDVEIYSYRYEGDWESSLYLDLFVGSKYTS